MQCSRRFVTISVRVLRMNTDLIRNFSIIAHIDHGKSTLADRILQLTGAVADRDMEAQLLDDMDLERERGITIKAHAVRLDYKAKDGKNYVLNLIDTPGHVDFSYEVSRSLSACEGALLVVDASQGVEAQTLANTYLAIENDLELIPVLNKIDLPSAEPDRIKEQIENIIGLDTSDAVLTSAKTGHRRRGRSRSHHRKSSAAERRPKRAAQSVDLRQLVRQLSRRDRAVSRDRRHDKKRHEDQVFQHRPRISGGNDRRESPASDADQRARPGRGRLSDRVDQDRRRRADRRHDHRRRTAGRRAFARFSGSKADGFCRALSDRFGAVRRPSRRDGKAALNDASFFFEPESSTALGFGFRCGFLGLLHMEIIQERLEREFNLELITTAPGVRYRVTTTDGEVAEIDSPSKMPDTGRITKIEEPFIEATILTNDEFLGGILPLLDEKRGVQKKFEYVTTNRVMLVYELPLNEIVLDFYDRLKSRFTRATLRSIIICRVIRKASSSSSTFSFRASRSMRFRSFCTRDTATAKGRLLTAKMKELIPRQMFEVAIQAAIGNKVIARETVKAMGKNVIAKCYGGDISRKRKLLEKQKEGKKRMKKVGRVEIPQEAFLAVLKGE